MVLLMKGSGVQSEEWHVNEPVAAGYSRVYLIEKGNVTYEESRLVTSKSACSFPCRIQSSTILVECSIMA